MLWRNLRIGRGYGNTPLIWSGIKLRAVLNLEAEQLSNLSGSDLSGISTLNRMIGTHLSLLTEHFQVLMKTK